PPTRRGGLHEIAGAFARYQSPRRQALRAPVSLTPFFAFSPFDPARPFLDLINRGVCNSFSRPHSHSDSLNRTTRHWPAAPCASKVSTPVNACLPHTRCYASIPISLANAAWLDLKSAPRRSEPKIRRPDLSYSANSNFRASNTIHNIRLSLMLQV